MLKWLRDHDYLNNSERKTTHTLMSGGVVGVPDDAYDDFLGWYATEVKSKNKTLSFSELRSDPVFCMYFDIDILDTTCIPEEISLRIFGLIQSVIKSYYTGDRNDDRFLCVVCTTTAKEIPAEGEKTKLIKSGYHITFPNLRVSLEQALQIRYSVVYELEKTMGPRSETLNAWSDVIDKAPYTSGLKMCGSFKRIKCPDCKKTDPAFAEKKKSMLSSMARLRRKIYPREHGFNYSDLSNIHADEFKDVKFGDMYGNYLELTGFNSCQTCLNTGKTIENRTYMPSLILDGGGDADTSLLDLFRENYFEIMKYTSIRCQQGESETPGYAIPKGVPRAPTEQNGANMRSFSTEKLTHLGRDMRAFTVNNDIYLSDAKTLMLWTGPRVEDHLRLEVIEKFIRQNICDAYSNVQIRKVCESKLIKKITSRSNGGTKMINSMVSAHSGTMPVSPDVSVTNRYLVNVAGVGSTYCMNKGAEHTSNSVYFIITPTVCYQKCFSKKSEVRMGGTTCANYKSGEVQVPASVAATLFPDDVEKHFSAPLSLIPVPRIKSDAKTATRSHKRSKVDWGSMKL